MHRKTVNLNPNMETGQSYYSYSITKENEENEENKNLSDRFTTHVDICLKNRKKRKEACIIKPSKIMHAPIYARDGIRTHELLRD